MHGKLSAGARFPDLALTLTDGESITLPLQPHARYLIVLFYRGAF